jgi:PleD family two-component response regulator
MILAILDDLLFSSKIRAAAKGLGVEVVFARSAEAALVEARKAAPSLVILDLNGLRTDPLLAVSALKSDAALASIPTVGFVSHVQGDLIRSARDAGVDEVFARSAFSAQLGAILSRHQR